MLMNTEHVSDQPARWSPHGTRSLAEATALVLELARGAGNSTTRAMLPPQVREAILLLCAQAHAERLTIERVIVDLKEGWNALPEVRRMPRGGAHEAMLACIITQCILDFYSNGELDRPTELPSRITRGQRT